MHSLVDIDQLTLKRGTYRTGTAVALKDPGLLPLAKMRRKQASQLMVPLDRHAALKRLPAGTYLIMPKIDGEFTLLVYRGGDIVSLNPYGTVRVGAPWHDEALQLLKKAGVKSAILGGELHVRRPDGKRARVHDVVSIARAPDTDADLATLAYAAFAIYELDGQDLTTKPVEQIAALRRIFKGGDRAHAIEAHEGDAAEVMRRFAEYVDKDGGEGVVALSTDLGWYKIKPRHTLDVAVVGFSDSIEERAGMLHSLLLAVVRDDGTYHLVGRTGGGFSDDQRRQFLADLGRRAADSQYTEVNSDRVAYRMITPGLVAEISCLDVITSSSEGEPIERMVLEYDGQQWLGIRRLPLASIISPQFLRFRDDKTSTATDVGLNQLTRITDIPATTATAREERLPASTLLRRAVATKELKGKTMVRKLMLWKTNKETLSPEHPAFVIALTDFSPNRKTPLERDIRVSSSLEQIEAYWQVWHAEQFVKGWVVK
jgi:hypothetical protein